MPNKPDSPTEADRHYTIAALTLAALNVMVLSSKVGDPLPPIPESVKWIDDMLAPLKGSVPVTWDQLRLTAHKLFDECCRRLKCADCEGPNDSPLSFCCTKCDAEMQKHIPFGGGRGRGASVEL